VVGRQTREELKSSDRSRNQVFKLLLTYLWPQEAPLIRKRFLLAFLCLVLSKVATVFVPIFYKEFIDHLSSISSQALWVPVVLLVSYSLSRMFANAFSEIRDVIFAKVEQRAVREIALTIFKHLMNLSLRFHLDRKMGNLGRIVDRGAKAIEVFLKFGAFSILPIIVEILLTCGILLYLYGTVFCLGTLFIMGIYVIFSLKMTQWRSQFVKTLNQADSDSSGKLVDSLLNYETVKYFGNESYEAHLYDQNLSHYEQIAIKNKLGLAILNLGQGIIIAIGLGVLLFISYQKLKEGTMSIGDVVLINAFILQLYLPLNILGFAYREIQRSLIEMEQMFGLLNQSAEIQDSASPQDLKIYKGEVVFENVSFAYDPDRQILKNVSFIVPAGKKVAIVGTSGAGKSTIARLLFRFYDVLEGAIFIDRQDIRSVSQDSLRRVLGIVPQDTVLFNNTIGYNIGYANPNAIFPEIQKAAKLAHLDEFIQKLPQKYEVLVGERGLKLSGGEKQRVAIARMLLKNPCIYVFDEATSALDTKTEKEILKNLNEVSYHRTTLVIAHRLSTIVDADEILVLDQGQIVEKGTHQELLKQNGLYAKMWERQSSLALEALAEKAED
jgi:ATP-binding cassette subfamily B protein